MYQNNKKEDMAMGIKNRRGSEVGNGFSVTVNYGLSVESLVAQGKYDWKNLCINSENFQTARKGEVILKVELVHLNQVLASEEVLKELDRRGLRPAELHELLSLGKDYPYVQRKHTIVALGSVWRCWSGKGFPCLEGRDRERGLSLDFGWWHRGCLFLAARES